MTKFIRKEEETKYLIGSTILILFGLAGIGFAIYFYLGYLGLFSAIIGASSLVCGIIVLIIGLLLLRTYLQLRKLEEGEVLRAI